MIGTTIAIVVGLVLYDVIKASLADWLDKKKNDKS